MLKLVDAGARSHLPFSPAFIAGDLMFVSGQASVDRDTGAIIPGTFEEEMRRSIENLRAILEAGGLSLDHVVNVKSYVASEADLALYNQIYPEYFSRAPPQPQHHYRRARHEAEVRTRLRRLCGCHAPAGGADGVEPTGNPHPSAHIPTHSVSSPRKRGSPFAVLDLKQRFPLSRE